MTAKAHDRIDRTVIVVALLVAAQFGLIVSLCFVFAGAVGK